MEHNNYHFLTPMICLPDIDNHEEQLSPDTRVLLHTHLYQLNDPYEEINYHIIGLSGGFAQGECQLSFS